MMNLNNLNIAAQQGISTAPQTPHGELLRGAMEENLKRIDALVSRCELFADHIVGCVPDLPDGTACKSDTNGFLASMRTVAADQWHGLNRISHALERLEREFGF